MERPNISISIQEPMEAKKAMATETETKKGEMGKTMMKMPAKVVEDEGIDEMQIEEEKEDKKRKRNPKNTKKWY